LRPLTTQERRAHCRAVFLDVEAMRRGRGGKPPVSASVVWSVVISILATAIVRRLRNRPKPWQSAVPGYSAELKLFDLAPFQSVVDMAGIGDKTRVVLTARFSSEEDRGKHVEEFQAVEGSATTTTI